MSGKKMTNAQLQNIVAEGAAGETLARAYKSFGIFKVAAISADALSKVSDRQLDYIVYVAALKASFILPTADDRLT